jgi:DNA-binding CsgD family transcriptional regulator
LPTRDREVTDSDRDRVSSRLLGFVFALLRHVGGDPRAIPLSLRSTDDLPPWVAWSDYIAAIHYLGDVAGGAPGVAAAMRATLDTAYSELRGFAGFFSGPIPFFAFVTHQFNVEVVPGAVGRVEMLGPRTLRTHYRIDPSLTPSRLYLEGTRTLIELFPTHFGLPEARVDTIAMNEREAELVAEFPDGRAKVKWGAYIAPSPTASLTQREQEVLQLVCEGLTNAEIGGALGTAASTVKTQISSILSKMNVANRTELAALASRRD